MVSTATIKLSKAEIDIVVRSLVVSIRISDVFDYNSEKANFTTLKDDFVKIKRMLDDGEQEYRNGAQTENGYHTVKVCDNCE
jgi:dimeric dUTPase (all-alpha-NTP-PPase superfamily)|tara:strand:+ start:387 stop:632 length:246 start_codon:yes stop_codon:yes gene_type:complete